MLNITKDALIGEFNYALNKLHEVIHEEHFKKFPYTYCEFTLCYSMYWKEQHPADISKYLIPFLYRVLQCLKINKTVVENLSIITEWKDAKKVYFYSTTIHGFNKRVVLLETAIEYIKQDKTLLLTGLINIV